MKYVTPNLKKLVTYQAKNIFPPSYTVHNSGTTRPYFTGLWHFKSLSDTLTLCGVYYKQNRCERGKKTENRLWRLRGQRGCRDLVRPLCRTACRGRRQIRARAPCLVPHLESAWSGEGWRRNKSVRLWERNTTEEPHEVVEGLKKFTHNKVRVDCFVSFDGGKINKCWVCAYECL